ncbi:hypothetical protein V1477_008760 [Vespula maculifrons]|uniref:Uncharacterized protein n=1 Tax=Vespula maculifrons TaxID=7453 RepID=A0ABD2CDY5_VESMC
MVDLGKQKLFRFYGSVVIRIPDGEKRDKRAEETFMVVYFSGGSLIRPRLCSTWKRNKGPKVNDPTEGFRSEIERTPDKISSFDKDPCRALRHFCPVDMEDNPCLDARSRSGLRSWVRSSGTHRVDIPEIAPLFMNIVVRAGRRRRRRGTPVRQFGTTLSRDNFLSSSVNNSTTPFDEEFAFSSSSFLRHIELDLSSHLAPLRFEERNSSSLYDVISARVNFKAVLLQNGTLRILFNCRLLPTLVFARDSPVSRSKETEEKGRIGGEERGKERKRKRKREEKKEKRRREREEVRTDDTTFAVSLGTKDLPTVPESSAFVCPKNSEGGKWLCQYTPASGVEINLGDSLFSSYIRGPKSTVRLARKGHGIYLWWRGAKPLRTGNLGIQYSETLQDVPCSLTRFFRIFRYGQFRVPNRWTVPREDPGHGGYGASIRKGLDRINLHGPENSKNSFLPSKRNRAVRGAVECPASIQTRLHLWSSPPVSVPGAEARKYLRLFVALLLFLWTGSWNVGPIGITGSQTRRKRYPQTAHAATHLTLAITSYPLTGQDPSVHRRTHVFLVELTMGCHNPPFRFDFQHSTSLVEHKECPLDVEEDDDDDDVLEYCVPEKRARKNSALWHSYFEEPGNPGVDGMGCLRITNESLEHPLILLAWPVVFRPLRSHPLIICGHGKKCVNFEETCRDMSNKEDNQRWTRGSFPSAVKLDSGWVRLSMQQIRVVLRGLEPSTAHKKYTGLRFQDRSH